MDKTTLYRFFEGVASFEEEEAIKKWMEESIENKKAFIKERKLFDAMLLLGEKVKITGIKRLSSLRTEVMKAVAIVILTLGLNILYQKLEKNDEPIAMQTISVPAGQRTNLILADGTNIWLNARTTIQYPVSFNSKERRIKLNGEAYFDVAKDKSKPFIVEAGNYNVEVLGTKFNVEAYSETGKFETSLMSGSVKVLTADQEGRALMLKPDNKVVLDNGELKVVKMEDYDYYRWKEGLVCFKEASFLSIMQELEKYYGISIRITSRDVHKYTFTGKFRQIEGIDHALKVLQKDIHFVYQRDIDNQVIYIR